MTDGDDREMELGNLELGGLYVLRGTHVEAFVRGAAALKVTSTNEGLLPVLASIVPRPTDALASGFDSNWLRSQVGLRVTSGPLVVGGSAGVDAAFSSDGELGRILHVSGSIGIAQPRFGVALGVTMLQPLEEGGGIVGFQAIADTAIGARTRLYSAFGLNTEDVADAFSLGIGLRTGL